MTTPAPGATSDTDATLQLDTTYEHRAVAFTADGVEDTSNTVQTTTTDDGVRV